MRILIFSWLSLIPYLANFLGIEMVFVSGQCQSHQQSLLLQMKNSLEFNSTLSINLVKWNQGTDCCRWRGVVCDEAGRVISLDLSNQTISGGLENSNGLFSLQYLQRLNLALNSFDAVQIPSRLANLTNLSYLNLSNAGFVGQIPIAISSMTRLVTLDLSSLPYLESSLLKLENPNLESSLLKLENPNLSLFLQNLTELREIYLDGVNISAHGNEWCQALSSWLPKLQVLSLSGCFLSGPIHHSLANLRSISMIRLDQNNLSSSVPDFFADFLNLTSLRLSNCGLYGTFPEKILQVPTLDTLDLSINQLLQGSLPNFPKNHSLRTLMLSFTSFSGTLPQVIGNLKNLSTVDIKCCNFTGLIPTSMANLTQLVYLDLSHNQFSGPIPSLHMSKTLNRIKLSRNVRTGVISYIGWEHLPNLVYVDLSYNLLNGSIPPFVFALPSLQQLLLANNQFDGQIHDFSNASSSVLDRLDLSGNRLEGSIPMSIFDLKDLKILILSSNKFNGTVQIDSIQQLRNLIELDLSYNSLAVNLSGRDSSFPLQISTLRLASCKLSMFPNLKNPSVLYSLDLSDNQISGKVPNWIWVAGNAWLASLNLSHNFLVRLQQPYSISSSNSLLMLDLHSNQLQGKFPYPPPNAVYVDYSNNNFASSIPADIGNFMSLTIFFSLANNRLTGVVPESLCNATNLLVFDLSNNNLIGSMPVCLFKMSDTFGVLKLRGNNLSGTLSGTFPGNCSLQTLDLNGNQLEGMVPKSLANCAMLEVLDLGNNQFYDTFPCWLQNVSSLHVLVLRSNNFSGNINCPDNNVSWPILQIIDLASNKFSGRLPKKWFLNLKTMMVDEEVDKSELKNLHYEFLTLNKLYYTDAVTVTNKGLEMELVKILTIFTSIDFSKNNFEGPIPVEIGQLKSLYVLNLSHNAFTGPIPSVVGNLRQIESLDLSVNNLNGAIPPELAGLNFLSFLNLSSNHLEGKIPSGTQLQSFLPSSFEGNEGLCGPPRTNDCPTNSSESPLSVPSTSRSEIDWFFIAVSIGFAVSFGVVVAPLTISMKLNKWYDDHINRFLNRCQ